MQRSRACAKAVNAARSATTRHRIERGIELGCILENHSGCSLAANYFYTPHRGEIRFYTYGQRAVVRQIPTAERGLGRFCATTQIRKLGAYPTSGADNARRARFAN